MRFRKDLAFVSLIALVSAGIAAARAAQSLNDLVEPGTQHKVLGTGYGFCEGPAADAKGNIYFSDGQKDSIHYYEVGKEVALFTDKSTDANGMMFNSKGELCVCEGAAYRIVAYNVTTKEKRVLASEFENLHFNEPNDLTIDAVDGFYFTDPNYGHRRQPTVRKEDVYYVAPDGALKRVSTVCKKPNGVILTPDGKTLYLADNGGRVVYKYDVKAPGVLTGETKWIDLGAGPDGMTLDEHGNLYVTCGRRGIQVYAPDGKSIGTIEVPYASNCVFGGPEFKTLYITSADKFLALETKVRGLLPLPARK